MRIFQILLFVLFSGVVLCLQAVVAEDMNINMRKQVYEQKTEVQNWKPAETAIIICDMWNEHWC
ncbi:MAG: hypothetical protein LBU34_16930, partial [Planctomycetaceae bacterium]|nr:hypothetical protein [Planctomycetaceae bacterium]